MKVVLCYPSLLPGNKTKYGLQPLGILSIAAELKRQGIDVEVIDADIEGLTVREMVQRILAAKPDIVGLSLMTPQLFSALEVASLLKKDHPDLPIALGGGHINSTNEDTFSFADCIDFSVYGEGELTMTEVVRKMEQGGFPDCLDGVPGVIYRNSKGDVIKNVQREWIQNLDDLPRIDHDMLDITKYQIPTMVGRYVVSMIINRGCPYKCIYCYEPYVMGKKLRYTSMGRVIEDIKYYHEKHGVENFVFKDSTFTANRKWVYSFCEALLESGIKINWRCNARVNTVDDELLKIMKKSGCFIINFGVESGHPQILKNLRKGVTTEQIHTAHDLSRKNGIRTYSTFIVGSPGESDETMKTTIAFARKIRPSLAMFFVAVAYPGTVMYEQSVNEGLVDPRWWINQGWDPNSSSAFEKRWGWTKDGAIRIPGFDAEVWQKRATRAFYLRPGFIWDTMLFTLRNPYFIKHLFNLGIELIPFYKIKMPWKKPTVSDEHRRFSKCPSAATWDYEKRRNVNSDDE
jgi:radical SAM superfamily enzyme YgiQ (UPF0313 family)